MAIFTKDGYGQIELNHVAWRRDGRIEAQSKLNADDFADTKAENGMLLAVDFTTREVKLPTKTNIEAGMPVAVNYSTEHLYDERTQMLKDFALGLDDVRPRLGYLAVGDKFTTNTLSYDEVEYTSEDLLVEALDKVATNPVYGGVSDTGHIQLSATKPTVGPVLRVVEYTDMPDGQPAVKLQVVEA